MRSVVFSLALAGACALWGEDAWRTRFAATFGGGTVPGTAVEVQTVGGWWSALPAAATNVFDGVRAGMALDGDPSDAAVFASDAAPAADDVTRVAFTVCPTALTQDPATGPQDAAAALTPALLPDGRAGWFGRARDGWVALSAAGAEPSEGKWIAGCVELRTVDGVPFVSYLVKVGAAYVRLATDEGRTWFPGAQAADQGEVAFSGRGRFGDFAGSDRSAETNDIVFLDGVNTVTNEVGEVAVVKDLVLARSDEGLSILGGDILSTSVALDLRRPRAGHPLTVEVGTFYGERPKDVGCAWFRGTPAKAYSARPVSTRFTYTPSADDYEHWFSVAVTNAFGTLLAREFYFSKLPVAYLATADGTAPTAKKEEHDGTLFLQGNDAWKSPYDGEMTLKVRGNTTAGYSKKPYKLKLAEKTKLFGMPKNKHWVLLANYNDVSHLRNKMAYDFAEAIGSLGMESTWVDCVLNGSFLGCYQLCEHIRIDKNRVDIFDWEAAAETFGASETNLVAVNIVTNDISGGYLFEFSTEYDAVSKYRLKSGRLDLPVMVDRPVYLATNPAMLQYTKDYLQQYFDACTSGDGYAEGRHYSELCDLDSMLAYWFVNELFANNDATKKSRFAYKDRGEKLRWGPVWDFDWGLASLATGNTPERWSCSTDSQGETSEKNSFFKEWVSDPYFCTQAYDWYWNFVRAEYVKVFAPGGVLARHAEYLAAAGAANDARWPRSRTFQEDVAILQTFFKTRLAWLDAQFADVPTLLASLRAERATHPWSDAAPAFALALDAVAGEAHGGWLGTVYGRRDVALVCTVGAGVARVDVFVNGLRAVSRVPGEGGRVEAMLPARTLTAEWGQLNCVVCVAYDAAGEILARTCRLVEVRANGSVLYLR